MVNARIIHSVGEKFKKKYIRKVEEIKVIQDEKKSKLEKKSKIEG